MIRSLRGMNDILSPDNTRFEYFINTATTIAKRYGFEYFEAPLLEETALFKRSVGESSDIVGKEMYQFMDKGENDVCLRPEGTAGVVRAFIQNKLDKKGAIQRFFYHGAMFRYERPQKGRLRQFHQFGVESFGIASVYEDASVIMMVSDILKALGISFKLKLNSLGCPECMPPYRQHLVNFLEAVEAHICDDCVRRKATNPIRVLDCKNGSCQERYIEAPKLLDNLCDGCDTDFETLQKLLDESGIDFEIDNHLVRGLDYYSKSAFEFVSDEIGAQSAIAGGGRYDRLVEFLDGKPTPAVGFAIGIERLLELIKIPEPEREGYYFGAMDEEAVALVMQSGQKKRQSDKVTIEYTPKSLKAHLKGADRVNARYCAVIGENELKEKSIWVKDLVERDESVIKIDSL
ncbi:MAG: histidine--tRNA ligase [Campylobacterota bacterium]|nr:histidine--tRNA ligase [Campylobacterota bacterium]